MAYLNSITSPASEEAKPAVSGLGSGKPKSFPPKEKSDASVKAPKVKVVKPKAAKKKVDDVQLPLL